QIKYNLNYLQEAKSKIKNGDEEFRNAFDVLIKAADSIRKIKYFPRVTNKKLTPASSDIHDYVSMATYYWPNPKTNNGLPYIGIDGKVNPEVAGINNYSNLVHLSNRVKILGLAYFFTSDDKYVKSAVSLLNVFFLREDTKMNPNFNHAQFIKGLNKGRIEGIVESRFFVDMLDGVELMKSSKSFGPEYYQGLRNWFTRFLGWMESSDLGKRGINLRNNIETVYHLQRIAYATFLGDKEKVVSIVNNNLLQLFNRQVNESGEQGLELRRAKPVNYSVANLKYWMDIEGILNNNNVNFIFGKSAVNSRAKNALAAIKKMGVGNLDPYHEVQYKSLNLNLNQDSRSGIGVGTSKTSSRETINSTEEAILVLTKF